MKQFLILALLVLFTNLSSCQNDESTDDSFQTSLTNFLSNLFGYNKDNTSSTSSTSTTTTTTTAAPAIEQTNGTNNGTMIGNNTVSNLTTIPVLNQTLDESAVINSTTVNQTFNASESNRTVISNGTQLSVEEPSSNITNDTGTTSTTTPRYSSTLSSSTSSYSTSYSTTFSSYSTYSTYPSEEEPNIDTTCYKPTVVSNFCTAPSDLTDVSFWDLYSAVFSDAVIDGLLMGCARGTWCLKDKYDYWDSLIAERVDIVMNSQIIKSVCEPGVISCIDRMADFFSNCSFYYQMTYTSDVLDLICDLKRNNLLEQACYKHTIEALHVTLADLIREESQPEDYVFSSPEETCKTPEAFMTQGLICVVNSCPGEENTFKNFKRWLWFTEIVDELIATCDYNVTECVALLQRPLNYVGPEDLQMMITVSMATMVTAVFLSLTVCFCYRRYRRNAVIKDGYQQLLNDGEES